MTETDLRRPNNLTGRIRSEHTPVRRKRPLGRGGISRWRNRGNQRNTGFNGRAGKNGTRKDQEIDSKNGSLGRGQQRQRRRSVFKRHENYWVS